MISKITNSVELLENVEYGLFVPTNQDLSTQSFKPTNEITIIFKIYSSIIAMPILIDIIFISSVCN